MGEENMGRKRLAICLFGHLRTYEKTYQSFFRNIVEPNLKDGWEIDIFMHTWDRLSSAPGGWQLRNQDSKNWFNTRELTNDDILKVKNYYRPKIVSIEKLSEGVHGLPLTIRRVNEVRENYEKCNAIKYDYIFYTRCDMLFVSPLQINLFLSSVEGISLDVRHCFCVNNFFIRSRVVDPRYLHEASLCFFANCSLNITNCGTRFEKDCLFLSMNYALYRDFFILRENGKLNEDTHPEVKLKLQLTQKDSELQSKNQALDLKIKELESLKFQYDSKIKELQVNLKTTQDSLSSLPIKKQTLEIKNLESDLKIKELKAKQIEKELGYSYNVLEELDLKKQELIRVKQQLDSKTKELESKNTGLESNLNYPIFKGNLSYLNTMTSAKDRIHNHLSYKLGKAMIENSKSLLGYIRMPYVLSYIKDKHKQEQKQYQEQIKKNPNLKLPKLESYKDYKEALKEKECFTYKLGEALMKADKTWYKGGYVKLWFEVRRLKKGFKKEK